MHNDSLEGSYRLHNDQYVPPSGNRTRKTTVRFSGLSLPLKWFTVRRFLLSPATLPTVDDDAAEGSTAHTGTSRVDAVDTDPRGTGGRKKWTKAQKKEKRGANKGRKFGKVHDQLELCWRVANGKICEHGDEFVYLSCHLSGYLLCCVDVALRMTSTRIWQQNRRTFDSLQLRQYQMFLLLSQARRKMILLWLMIIFLRWNDTHHVPPLQNRESVV